MHFPLNSVVVAVDFSGIFKPDCKPVPTNTTALRNCVTRTFPTLPEEGFSVLIMKALLIVFLCLILCSHAMEISRAKRRACAPVLCYRDPCMGVICPEGQRCRAGCYCNAECGGGGFGPDLFRRVFF
ncbi:uncharacterized protein LOC144870947 [Branchiostoma floridae x Branchiostoma japonicum]